MQESYVSGRERREMSLAAWAWLTALVGVHGLIGAQLRSEMKLIFGFLFARVDFA